MDNVVHKALLQEELRPLEALGQLLADGLLDHPGAGEPDEGPGLGQNDIPQHSEAGRHAARSGIGENGDV